MIKEFKPLTELKEELISFLQQHENILEGDLRFIASPYRICPLGAHIDHQGGPVLGMTINAYTVLAFIPVSVPRVRLYSMNFPGTVDFDVKESGPPVMDDWGRYAKGAAKVLTDLAALRHGFIGAVSGTLPSSGLSSSASAGLAYLYGLSRVNEFDFSPNEFIELDRRLENGYLGLKNGILDQATIINGKRENLLLINTITGGVMSYPKPIDSEKLRIIVVNSGYRRELTSSGFNTRVEECRMAAKLIGELSGMETAEVLSDIPEEVYKSHQHNLPEQLRRRADHYYSEVDCVRRGVEFWSEGDWSSLGKLMNRSCMSSINNYESGSLALARLHQIISDDSDVYGCRFSGGGYGGCVIGFVKPNFGERNASKILNEYMINFPEVRESASIYFAETDDGIRFE